LPKFALLLEDIERINSITMRKDIHPEDYRPVVFKDMSNDYAFLCPSCAPASETITWEDGNEYPLVKLDISHKSHPFFTGIVQFVDTAGRIDKFNNRFGARNKK
jgi:large subunit ribosomal protein L31|tara:strand:+ start:37986 stop:38297 length:312 start_codon:yes stop_codon:yes gene_type:complete